MSRHTMEELKELQALPLSIKLSLTRQRIREWISVYGLDGVYVSFSGGKDSTVLLDIVRSDYPDAKACFINVPTQYPELREFAMTFDNVDIVNSKISFAQVCEKYGFPFFSKEVAEVVSAARKADAGNNGKYYQDCLDRLYGRGRYEEGAERSAYALRSYLFMLDAPFEISKKCCYVMKKEPAHRYEKETGRKPITGTTTEESRLRQQNWIQHSCNFFDSRRPVSNPMSFWKEQDVLQYIKEHNLKLCSVYGEVVPDQGRSEQIDLASLGLYEDQNCKLKCTGCNRTGCVLCGFGAQLPGDTRFVDLKESHSKMHGLLDIISNNGVTMRQAIDWINCHSNKTIRY